MPEAIEVPPDVAAHWLVTSVRVDGDGVLHVEALPRVPFRCAVVGIPPTPGGVFDGEGQVALVSSSSGRAEVGIAL